TGNVVAVIHAEPGYDRALNFHKTAPPHWSADSSVLLWQVYGKWFPDALVLLKLEGGKEKWRLDLLKTAQQAILARTKEAVPEKYAARRKRTLGMDRLTPMGLP